MMISYHSDSRRLLEPRAQWWFVMLTLFLAVALEFAPLPEWLFRYKPSFAALALVYWAINQPRLVNYAAAVIIGLLMDLANQSPLGFNGLSFCTLVWCANAFRGRFALLGKVGQAAHIFVFLSLGVAVLFVANLFDAGDIKQFGRRLFLPPVVGAFLWLLLPLFIGRLRALFADADGG